MGDFRPMHSCDMNDPSNQLIQEVTERLTESLMALRLTGDQLISVGIGVLINTALDSYERRGELTRADEEFVVPLFAKEVLKEVYRLRASLDEINNHRN